MKGDYSRLSFDAKKHYRAVLMQQGRLQLDADWNEQVQIAEHRYSAFFRSLVGRSGTPRKEGRMCLEKDEAGQLFLSKGICYIDGLLIENDVEEWVSIQQKGEDFLCYLEAWTREVSAAEDRGLIDSAIGLETTTRLKTEWALRCQRVDWDADAAALFRDGKWPTVSDKASEKLKGDWWKGLSEGTLRRGAETLSVNSKDNRLYRIEVHRDGSEAFFKWSTDNACTCAEVKAVENMHAYELTNPHMDIQKAFMGAKWIEIEAVGEPGFLLDTEEVSFENGLLRLPEGLEKKPKALIRRWDGVVFKGEESFFKLLGLHFHFSKDAFYRHGDYWLIQIRDGEIVNWGDEDDKPVEGVERHFAALGFVHDDGAGLSLKEPLHVVFDSLASPSLSTTEFVEIGSPGTPATTERLKVNGATTLQGNLTGTTGSFSEPTNPMELLVLGVSPQSLNFDSGFADSKTVEVFSKTSWVVGATPIWLSVTPGYGSGNAVLTVRVDANTGTAPRSGSLTFTSDGHVRTLKITQGPLPEPVISGFLPSEAANGSALSILGGNFDPTADNNSVYLNSYKVTALAATATQLTVTVPKNKNCSGLISVVVGNKKATSAARFNYVPTGVVTTLAGNGTPDYLDATGLAARFNYPRGIAIDSAGNLYVADTSNQRIRKVTPDGVVTTFAGNGTRGYANNDDGLKAQFNTPSGLAIDSSNNLYVAEYGNHRIRKVTPSGVVTTIAGSTKGFLDTKVGTDAQFENPHDIAIDATGSNLYVTDSSNQRIRKVTLTEPYNVTTFSGSGTTGFADGAANVAEFEFPVSIARDSAGNFYVADNRSYRIRKISSSGGVSTFVGSGKPDFADGQGTAANFFNIFGMVADTSNNLYVAAYRNCRIRRVTPEGMVNTIAGNGSSGSVDGTGTAAQFASPYGIAIDAQGVLYVTEEHGHCIRKIVLE
ncbi:MAG: DUF6519 domain-containing protein [Cystobacterineae bacterium]|nr:DUF6519 domain-containing protein [Cystobacterineae bacterium]